MYHSSEGGKRVNFFSPKMTLSKVFMSRNVLATQSNMLELNVRKFSFGLISGKVIWLERALRPSMQMLLHLL